MPKIKPYTLSIKLYGPDGRKINHKEIELPDGLSLEGAELYFKGTGSFRRASKYHLQAEKAAMIMAADAMLPTVYVDEWVHTEVPDHCKVTFPNGSELSFGQADRHIGQLGGYGIKERTQKEMGIDPEHMNGLNVSDNIAALKSNPVHTDTNFVDCDKDGNALKADNAWEENESEP